MSDAIARVEPLADQVYRYLREQILSGLISPGSRIVESKIAKELSVSRSPVREAIRLLNHEGLLTIEQGATMIFQPSLADFEDLYTLRLAVEPVAARLAAQHITAEDCQRLEETLRQTDETLSRGDIQPFIESNTRFHDLIVELSRNRRLQKVMSEVSAITRYYRCLVFQIYHRRVPSVEEHWQIYRAIQQGCPQDAQQRMSQHIENDLAFIQSIHATREDVILDETTGGDSRH